MIKLDKKKETENNFVHSKVITSLLETVIGRSGLNTNMIETKKNRNHI
jgi:hypothetical protein